MILLDIVISGFELFGLIASIVSIALAIVSVVLSMTFYKWTEKSNKEISTQANNIDNNTKKIEILFNKLYSGTFDMMKRNMEAMQNHVFGHMVPEDSSLGASEILEESIITFVAKSGTVTTQSACHYIQMIHKDKKYENSQIVESIEKLKKQGDLYESSNMITLVTKSAPNTAEGSGSSEQSDSSEVAK